MRRVRPDREDNHGAGRSDPLDERNALIACKLLGREAGRRILMICVS